MPFNGTGTFNVKFALVPNTTALAEDINTLLTDIASGLSDALTRDGEAPATSNISMGGFQLTDLAPASTPSGAITLSQAGSGIPVANASITGPAGTTRSLFFQTTETNTSTGVQTLSNRFEFQVDAEAESGANAGSNMIVNAYADDGSTDVQMAVVTRSTGAVSIKTQWDFTSTPTVNGASILPTGIIQAFASSAIPAGFLGCDGSAVSRTTYAALFAIIGGIYGAGDGSTTFNVPDLRGVSLRGIDAGRGLDPGRALGSYQADQLQTFIGTYAIPTTTTTEGGGTGGVKLVPSSQNYNIALSGANFGAETRGKNVAVSYIIKT